MKKNLLLVWTVILLSHTPWSASLREGRDSYMDAYTETHGFPLPPTVEYSDPSYVTYPNAVYEHHSQPYEPDYKPHPHSYDQDYEHQTQPYEHYFTKPHFYGPPSGPSGPAPIYGPPSGSSGPAPVYGPPYPPLLPPNYEPPQLVSKGLEFGITFATLCKILLKVLIFKMIVKFIAVICLLLFFPKLDSGSGSSSSAAAADSSDTKRKFSSPIENDRLNNLTRVVLESLDKNSRIQVDKECGDEVGCTLTHVSKYIDKHYTVSRLFSMLIYDYEKNLGKIYSMTFNVPRNNKKVKK